MLAFLFLALALTLMLRWVLKLGEREEQELRLIRAQLTQSRDEIQSTRYLGSASTL